MSANLYHVLQHRELYAHEAWSVHQSHKFWGPHAINIGGLEYLTSRLEYSGELDTHHGCVNTVRWNSLGTMIVSGSDDCHLGIWKVSPHNAKHSRLVSHFRTGHDANIFHALFVPGTSDDHIVSCALDCNVRYNKLSRSSSELIGSNHGSCHKMAIIEPTVFMTCSEDGSVKLIDMRDPATVNNTENPAHVKNALAVLTKIDYTPPVVRGDWKSNESPHPHSTYITKSNIPKVTKTKVSCYTMALHPLNNNTFAVGCRDRWIRLFDRRQLTVGDGRSATPYCLMTQHVLAHRKQSSGGYFNEEGVTGLAWSYDGRELVGTYSQRHVALFDLYSPRSCADFDNCAKLAEESRSQHDDTSGEPEWIELEDTSSDENDSDTDDEKMEDRSNNLVLLEMVEENKQPQSDEEESQEAPPNAMQCEEENKDEAQNVPESATGSKRSRSPSSEDADTLDGHDTCLRRPKKRRRLESPESPETEPLPSEVCEEKDVEMQEAQDLERKAVEIIEARENDSSELNPHNPQRVLSAVSAVQEMVKRQRSVSDGDVPTGMDDMEESESSHEIVVDKTKESSDRHESLGARNVIFSHNNNTMRSRSSESVTSRWKRRAVRRKNQTKQALNNASMAARNFSSQIKQRVKQRVNHSRMKLLSFKAVRDTDGAIPICLQRSTYKGHRTVETVKEVNFFGPRSEFVISGSDCGHVFIWRKSDAELVNILEGDSRITNVVQGNPVTCSLVTSGLDTSVKYFLPTADEPSEMKEKESITSDNERHQVNRRGRVPASLLYLLLRRGLIDLIDSDADDDRD